MRRGFQQDEPVLAFVTLDALREPGQALSQNQSLHRLKDMTTERNVYSVSPGERPILVHEMVQATENVVFIDPDSHVPFALVVAESESRAYEIGAPLFMYD
jgi:hypothetical protein